MFIFVLILLSINIISRSSTFTHKSVYEVLYGLYLRMLYICCVNKTLYDIVKPNQTK